jgi:hypothetical protein
MKSRIPIKRSIIKQIVADFMPEHKRAIIVRRLISTLKTAEKLRITNQHVLDPNDGLLVKKLYIGEVWKSEKRQRRRKNRYLPDRGAGAPPQPYLDYLVASLGFLYCLGTEKNPTIARSDEDKSDFQNFVAAILEWFDVYDGRGRIKDYLKERKSALAHEVRIACT